MWAFYSSVSTLYEHWNVCRLCACNPTLEALDVIWACTDAARFDQSLFFCVCPFVQKCCLCFCCQYKWYRNKVVYIHGLLPVHFISNNGTEMVSHTWGAVLLHEVTTKLFPVRLMSTFFLVCFDHSGTFLTYNLPPYQNHTRPLLFYL